MTTTTQPTAPAPNAGQSTAHTPGPWEASGSRITQGGPKRAWQLTIAILPTTVDPRPTADAAAKSIAERDANAQLMASAPDLLTALKGAAMRLRNGYGSSITEDEVERLCPALRNARAAIAKAGGAQ